MRKTHSLFLPEINTSLRAARSLLCAVTATVFLASAAFAEKLPQWAPIPAAHLNAKPENPETEAIGVEVLVRKLEFELEGDGLYVKEFSRRKIYSNGAAEDARTLRVMSGFDGEVQDARVRVTYPDGSEELYEIGDFQKLEAAKYYKSGEEFEVLSLVLKELPPGTIVEAASLVANPEWLEGGKDKRSRPVGYRLNRDFSMRELEFHLRVRTRPGSGIFSQLGHFNIPNVKIEGSGGDISLRATNIPAYRKEPALPPAWDEQAAVLAAFRPGLAENESALTTWNLFADYRRSENTAYTSPASSVKSKARELTANANTPEEKVRLLYNFCQTQIINENYVEEPAEDAPKRKEKYWPRDVLREGRGTSAEINGLFVALVNSVGIPADLTLGTARDVMINMNVHWGWLIDEKIAIPAVKLGDTWIHMTPGNRSVPYGLLHWRHTGVNTMISEKGKPVWARSAIFPAENAKLTRDGKFVLSEKGLLTGEVTETLEGQEAINWRESQNNKWEKKQGLQKMIENRIRKFFKGANVSEIAVDAPEDNTKPVTIRYKLAVANFATQAGDRIIFAPDVFHAKSKPLFTEELRTQAIFFDQASYELDRMEIKFPEGYELEVKQGPTPLGIPEIGIRQQSKFSYYRKSGRIVSESHFVIGENGMLSFKKEAYKGFKALFEEMNRSQTFTLVLKPKEAATPETQKAPATPQPAP